MNNLNLDEQK